jgi:small-conductance mechanosensitive channel
MELRPITNAVTKTLVIVIFWVVLLIDLILEPTISFKEIALALIKAVVISGVFWLLFVMLVDTFLKTILLDAKEKKADRTDGGLSYHVTEPNAEELAWLRAEEREKEREAEKEKEKG